MSDRIERETSMHLGAEARSFLQNPQYQQSLSDARDRIFLAWAKSTPGQSEQREQLWQEWNALGLAERGLRNQIDEGTIARAEQDRDNYRANLG